MQVVFKEDAYVRGLSVNFHVYIHLLGMESPRTRKPGPFTKVHVVQTIIK